MFGQAVGNFFQGGQSVDQAAANSINESSQELANQGVSYEGSSHEVDFDINDPNAVKNMQTKLVDNDANALPQYGVDSKWGEESQNAYNKYMDQQKPVQQAFSNDMEKSWLKKEGGGGTSTDQDGYKSAVYATPQWGLRKQF